MEKLSFLAVLPLLFVSCATEQAGHILTPQEIPPDIVTPIPFIITDHKYKSEGRNIPEWVSLFLEGGIQSVESLAAFNGRHVFISQNEGTNFNALNHWKEGFSPELDFPRLAAARIDARFFSETPLPDQVYGAFFEALIRTASNARWSGAVKEDDFWIRRRFIENNAESETENWLFLILVSIEKPVFALQLDTVFSNTRPNPPPSRGQLAAINRVKDNFFEGF